jgi:phage gp45-like
MIDALARMATRLRLAITRAKLVQASFGGTRTVLQLQGLPNQVVDKVELFSIYGASAVPLGGTVILLEVAGQRDHKAAIVCDDPSLRIADLAPGEFGFRDQNGTQIVFRGGKLEVTSSLPIDITSTTAVNVTAPQINLGASGETLFAFMLAAAWTYLKTHTHSGVAAGAGNSGPPNSAPSDASVLTSTVKGG